MTEIIRVPNIEDYIQEIINGELILTPKYQYISKEDLQRTKLKYSSIIKCNIKNNKDNTISNSKKSYKDILIDIWVSMPTQQILQNTSFNLKLTNENGKKGYIWCEKIKMSIQNRDADNTIKEILHMLVVNNYNIKISIKLENGIVICLKI